MILFVQRQAIGFQSQAQGGKVGCCIIKDMISGRDFVGFFHGGGRAAQWLAGFFYLVFILVKGKFINQFEQVFGDVGKFLRAFARVKEGFGKKAAIKKEFCGGDGFYVWMFPVPPACTHLTDLAVFAGKDGPFHFAVGCDEHVQCGACLSRENVHCFGNSFQVQ